MSHNRLDGVIHNSEATDRPTMEETVQSLTLPAVLETSGALPTSCAPWYTPTLQERDEARWYCASDVRLLVVDDDPMVCRVIQSALARNDFTVEAVSDPTQ